MSLLNSIIAQSLHVHTPLHGGLELHSKNLGNFSPWHISKCAFPRQPRYFQCCVLKEKICWYRWQTELYMTVTINHSDGSHWTQCKGIPNSTHPLLNPESSWTTQPERKCDWEESRMEETTSWLKQWQLKYFTFLKSCQGLSWSMP